jgi:hypothetical protein
MLVSITADGVTMLMCVETRTSSPNPSLPTNLLMYNLLTILQTHILLNCSYRPLNLVTTILPNKEYNNQLPNYFNGSIISFYSPLELHPFFSLLIYTQPVRLLVRGINPSQGRYLHTEQHKHRINVHRHPCLEWDSNPRSQCSSGRKRFMP